MRTFAVFEGTQIIRMSTKKSDLVKYLNSFTREERKARCIFLAEQNSRFGFTNLLSGGNSDEGINKKSPM